ncbi:helix-turn-helix transcriptional regulator [Pseudarthrobacter oxydans]|uniref:helix-turn-helix transcriptional regulator n=1 Tax=Pseudarthrobacter oxydans TaxID=1671 RepID=UPI00382A0A3C
MSRRKPGSLLPLEVHILRRLDESQSQGISLYGASLASALTEDDGKSLTAHGTVYKALARLATADLLDAEWEDAAFAKGQRRRRRRHYRITAEGKNALQAAKKGLPAHLI